MPLAESEVDSFYYCISKILNHNLHISNIIVILNLNLSLYLCLINIEWHTTRLFSEGLPWPPLLSAQWSSLCILHLHLHDLHKSHYVIIIIMRIIINIWNQWTLFFSLALCSTLTCYHLCYYYYSLHFWYYHFSYFLFNVFLILCSCPSVSCALFSFFAASLFNHLMVNHHSGPAIFTCCWFTALSATEK